jgi:hypothetical protein
MSLRRPSGATQSPATPSSKNSGKFLVVVPKWFVFETMLASVAVGALMVEMRLVSQLTKSARGK